MIQAERELLRLLPKVLRARDFHLYLENGKRLTDLWLSGGRAVLGHKPPNILRELKNAAERGLFSPFPHPIEKRFIKALLTIFPGRAFCVFVDSGSLCRALEKAGFTAPIPLWRPFLEGNDSNVPSPCEDNTGSKLFFPVLPWPLGRTKCWFWKKAWTLPSRPATLFRQYC